MPSGCCNHYVSKSGRPRSGHGTGKCQSSSQFPRRVLPECANHWTIALISHASKAMPRQVSATEWLGTQQPRPLSFYHGTIILTTSTQEFYMVKRRWQVSDKDILNKCGDLGALLGEHGRVYGLHNLSSSYGAEVKMTSKEQRSGLGSQFVP